MKQKKTLQERLAGRRYDIPPRTIHFLYRTLMTGIVGRKYHAHYTIKDKIAPGPCFVVWNHLSRRDHAFVMEACWPRRISILAGYNEFFRSHLAFVFRLYRIIPKKNYTDDMNSIRAMHQVIKKGGCIALSPEGMSSIYGTNQPIVPGTGRFLQSYGIPVYFVKLAGSYLSSTKVCTDDRPGKVEVELSLLFSPEQLHSMTAEQIDDAMNEAFRHDDYAWNKEHRVKYKTKGNVCDHLNDICYKCPRCGQEFHITSEKDYIRCEKCGNGATMDDYYQFHPFDDTCVIPEFPTKWVEMERKDIIDAIRRDDKYSMTAHVKIGCLPKYHLLKNNKTSEPCGEGDLTIDHDGLHFKGTKFGEPWSFDLPYSVAFSLIIVTTTQYFSLYVDREYYDVFPESPIVGKMLLLTEEMHRLHSNVWKNFKWCDHLYE